MLDPGALLPFAILALVGSMHCAGMCGGFAVAVCAGGESLTGKLALYATGKAFAYASLGVGVALASHATASGELAGLPLTRDVLAWLAGGGIVLAGVFSTGLVPLRQGGIERKLIALVEPTWRGLLALGPASRSFGIGVLTGFLPCGLSWSALALATQCDPPTAAVGMFLFGLGTAPVLASIGFGHSLVSLRIRRAARWLLGPALILLGIATIARGGLPFAQQTLPACCREVEPGPGT